MVPGSQTMLLVSCCALCALRGYAVAGAEVGTALSRGRVSSALFGAGWGWFNGKPQRRPISTALGGWKQTRFVHTH